MKTVGVRELKNRLSDYLRRVRSGESVLVTHRGQVVAELTPPGQGATDASVPAARLALARRNLLTIGARRSHGRVGASSPRRSCWPRSAEADDALRRVERGAGVAAR